MFGAENLDVLVRTVSATPKEYISGLRQAVPDGVLVDGNEITVESGSVSIHIAIDVLPDYVIALMRLLRVFPSHLTDGRQRALPALRLSFGERHHRSKPSSDGSTCVIESALTYFTTPESASITWNILE